MKYLHKVFKAKKGSKVMVHFSQPTKVMLMGDYHYKQYKEHKTFSYRGGMMEGNSHEFEIPNDGLWHIVIEKGSYFNPMAIEASVELQAAK